MALQIRAADTSASAEIELPAPDIDAAYHVDGFMQPSPYMGMQCAVRDPVQRAAAVAELNARASDAEAIVV